MKKVLIAYFSSTGKAETMAGYVAEGVRFSGQQAVLKKIQELKNADDLEAYDGYIFGSPTFSLDLPKPVKTFLSLMSQINPAEKLVGAFGSYRHDAGYKHDAFAPTIILDTLEKENKMQPFELGPLNLQEDAVETRDGIKSCQDYGKVFGEKLS